MKDLPALWATLFAPCYCVPVREARDKLRELDRGPTRFLHLDGKHVSAGDMDITCPHCEGTEVIPTSEGRDLLRALLVHLKKLRQEQPPF